MGYYGLANFASDFNNVRGNALDSGFRAKQRMRDDWLGDYQMPEKMLGSDVDALSNSLKFDTLNKGYGDMMQWGLNDAATGNTASGVNLRKAQADDSVASLRAKAVGSGLTNEADIANYVAQNIDPAEASVNPYLTNAGYTAQRAASQRLANMGLALGGAAGDTLAGQGVTGLGYGLTPGRDENGNLIFTDAEGRTTAPLGPSGQIPAGLALGGDVGPAAQYYSNQEAARAKAATVTAQLQQKNDYGDLRYATELERQRMRDETTQEGYANRLAIAQSRGQKGMPSSVGIAAIGGGSAPRIGSGYAMGAPAWPSGGAASGTPNPFMQAGAPGTPTPGPVAGPYMPPAPAGAYQPARLTPDAAAQLAALSASGQVAPPPGTPTAQLAPPAYAPSAPPAAAQPAVAPDPETDFNQASAQYDALARTLKQFDRDAGPMTVYGPSNAPPGWATAREQLSDRLYQAMKRRDDAEKAMKSAQYSRSIHQAEQDARARAAREAAAGQALLGKYLPSQAGK